MAVQYTGQRNTNRLEKICSITEGSHGHCIAIALKASALHEIIKPSTDDFIALE